MTDGQDKKRQARIGLGISVGAGIGAAVGLLMDNVALGIGPGVALGLLWAVVGSKTAR